MNRLAIDQFSNVLLYCLVIGILNNKMMEDGQLT